MGLLEELREMGADIDGGLKRLGNNEKLYTKLLGTFVKTLRKHDIVADFSDDELTEVIENAHAIKGTSGNLSISPLFDAYSQIMDLLRTGKVDEARPLIANVLPVQEQIISCIEKYVEIQ